MGWCAPIREECAVTTWCATPCEQRLTRRREERRGEEGIGEVGEERRGDDRSSQCGGGVTALDTVRAR